MSTKDPILITNPCDYLGEIEDIKAKISQQLNVGYVDKLQQVRKNKLKSQEAGKKKKKKKQVVNDSEEWLLISPGSERRVIWNNPDVISDSD